MSKFIKKAMEKLPKLDKEQVRSLLMEVVGENDLLEMVLSSMSHGVVVTDENHRILFHNRSSQGLFPLRTGDIAGNNLWEMVDDPDISILLKNNLENQGTFEDHEVSLDFRGSFRIFSLTLLPLVQAGRIRGNLFQIEDISDRKGRESRLRRAENLASLTTLAAGVAHEIKNPLGSIGIHVQLIQKSMDRNVCEEVDTERISKFLDVIAEEVERLNGIVVDFLFAVRPMDTQLISSDLNKLIEDLISFLQFELEDAHIKTRSHLDRDLPKINLDDRFIKQALLNIVKNAMNAMEDGGILTIETKRIGNEVNLIIGDTGKGMPEEVREKIFEPYFTTRDNGSGLGLTLVYKIMKEHQGEIQVDSEEGKGTRFILSFPVPQKEKHLIEWEGE